MIRTTTYICRKLSHFNFRRIYFHFKMVVRPNHVADNLNKILNNYLNSVALDGNPWTSSNTRNGMQTTKFKIIIIIIIAWPVKVQMPPQTTNKSIATWFKNRPAFVTTNDSKLPNSLLKAVAVLKTLHNIFRLLQLLFVTWTHQIYIFVWQIRKQSDTRRALLKIDLPLAPYAT
jgi:hypothetical protein